MPSTAGRLVTETFDFDGGRQVTAYVPGVPAEAIVFAGDGELVAPWGADLEATGAPPTLVVGVHRQPDETLRLHEYSPGFDPARFTAHEAFFTHDVRVWVHERFAVTAPAARTAVHGVSAGGELALALGLHHPEIYGAVLCASPGAGFTPPQPFSHPLPRAYLVAGTEEPFFHDNATAWATALHGAGAEVVMTERVGAHGDGFWRTEFPLMVSWAFGR